MFGSIGIFREDLLFAIFRASNQAFLKVNSTYQADLKAKDKEPFDHPNQGKDMPYLVIFLYGMNERSLRSLRR